MKHHTYLKITGTYLAYFLNVHSPGAYSNTKWGAANIHSGNIKDLPTSHAAESKHNITYIK